MKADSCGFALTNGSRPACSSSSAFPSSRTRKAASSRRHCSASNSILVNSFMAPSTSRLLGEAVDRLLQEHAVNSDVPALLGTKEDQQLIRAHPDGQGKQVVV